MDSLESIIDILPIIVIEPDVHRLRPEWPWYVESQNYSHGFSCAFCHVCEQTYLEQSELPKHLTSPAHRENVDHFNRRLKDSLKVLKRVKALNSDELIGMMDRLEALESPTWKNDVLSAASLTQFITDGEDATGQEGSFLSKTMTSMVRYEYMERIVLLKLAVWKAECKKHVPDTNAVLDIFAVERWLLLGWKQFKSVHRTAGAMDVVATSVAPFLDPPNGRYKPMKIRVHTLVGKKYTIYVGRFDPVGNVSKWFEAHVGFSTNDHHIIFEGRTLEKHCTFDSYNIRENSIIHVILRLGGGPRSRLDGVY